MKNDTPTDDIRTYVLRFFEQELRPHFREEEEFLFKKLFDTHELRRKAEEDHRHIYQLIDDLQRGVQNYDWFEAFADHLEQHIRFEERQFFNLLQTELSDETLAEVATQIAARNRTQEALGRNFDL
jgi:hemerythrin-like domain-containing protein